jgi:hypothetical protein
MTLPNFLVIGAAKAGTTSLEMYLRQHPEIFFNATWKELRFYAYDGRPPAYDGPGDVVSNRHTITTLAAYEAQFREAAGRKAVGEVSPVYLYSPRAPERIAHYTPDVKLIAVLRNPVERAYSHYLHLRRDRRETETSFARALALEEERIRRNWEWSWHYRRVGLYHEQLARYVARFDRSRIRIFLYDDFQRDPCGVIGEILRFLEVDDAFVPDTSVRHNVSGLPRSRSFPRALMRTRTYLLDKLAPVEPYIPSALWRGGGTTIWALYNANFAKPPIEDGVRRELVDYFRDDVRRLERLVGRDVSHWLEVRP